MVLLSTLLITCICEHNIMLEICCASIESNLANTVNSDLIIHTVISI